MDLAVSLLEALRSFVVPPSAIAAANNTTVARRRVYDHFTTKVTFSQKWSKDY